MAKKIIDGRCIGPGRGCGTLICLEPSREVSGKSITETQFSPEKECERFHEHAMDLSEEMNDIADELRDDAKHQEAEIFNAHAAILRDDEFHDRVRKAIEGLELAAEKAVQKVLDDMAEVMKETQDEVFSERAADFRDLENQLCQRLAGCDTGIHDQKLEMVENPIVALQELPPSIALKAQRHNAKGFVVEEGTGYSHGAVLAKSFDECVLRIPSLEAVREHEGEEVLVDAVNGHLLIEPGEEEKENLRWPICVEHLEEEDTRLAQLWVNVLRPGQLESFQWGGVKGVGLYRTETLFMEKEREFPTEEEQYEAYSELFQHASEKIVTVRTLDIGADKPAASLWLGPQENPQLGLRAHRLYHFHPEILITQIRAILRAAVGFENLRVMYPMIESIDQLEFVQGLTDHAIKTLHRDSVDFKEDFERGVLVETPSAVWSFPTLIDTVDFASVGTNDLVQYMFAVDRNAASVSTMYTSEHPVVYQIIHQLVEQAREAGKPISCCGEMAADLRSFPVLLGLGMRDLSVSPRAIPILEEKLHDYELEECQELAQRCLESTSAHGVEQVMEDWAGVPHKSEIPPEREIIDPVCKEQIDPENTTHVVSVGQVKYYFCSEKCMDTFMRWTPEPTDDEE